MDGSYEAARPPDIDTDELQSRYGVFLLDAYGVLVDGTGALPGAAEFLADLRRRDRTFMVLSNDASRSPGTSATRYRSFGLPLDPAQILTSGTLLADHLRAQSMAERPCIVLGPPESQDFVRSAGAHVVAADDPAAEALVVCDDAGYPFLPTIEDALSTAITRLDRGEAIHLVLPNPDQTYPKSAGKVGLTAGSVALVIEHALKQRFGDRAPTFARLGKPHRPIFDAALERLGRPARRDLVMVGDQLHTDIAGANDMKIDSVLIGSGITSLGGRFSPAMPRPTWLLRDLQERSRARR